METQLCEYIYIPPGELESIKKSYMETQLCKYIYIPPGEVESINKIRYQTQSSVSL